MKRIPLSESFSVVSIILLIISLFFTAFGRISPQWGFIFIFMFTIFVISSMVSILPEGENL